MRGSGKATAYTHAWIIIVTVISLLTRLENAEGQDLQRVRFAHVGFATSPDPVFVARSRVL